MADKLSQTVLITPAFTDGEIPIAEKFTTIGSVMQSSNRVLERAVGDVLDQNFPYATSMLSTGLNRAAGNQANDSVVANSPLFRWLDIASLARLMGPASNLNPHHLGEGHEVTQVVPTGVHSFALEYSTANIQLFTESTPSAFVTEVGLPDLLAGPGDYYIDYDKGVVHTFTLIGDTDNDGVVNGGYSATVNYEIDPRAYGGFTAPQGARFNTIPDLAQLEAGSGLVFDTIDGGGNYVFDLPTITHQQWSLAQNDAALTAADANFGVQLKLPRILEDTLSPGDTVPENFIVLKNYTTGNSYPGAVFTWVDAVSIAIGGIDLTTELGAGDELYLVTVGTDITSSIDHLRRIVRYPGSRDWGMLPVDARQLSNATAAPGNSGPFAPSTNDSNIFPQYLHRDGYDAGDAGVNDQGAMRGHILMGLEGADAGSHVDVDATTYKIAFGTVNQAFIRYNGTELAIAHAENGTLIDSPRLVDTTNYEAYPRFSNTTASTGQTVYYKIGWKEIWDADDKAGMTLVGSFPGAGSGGWAASTAAPTGFQAVSPNLNGAYARVDLTSACQQIAQNWSSSDDEPVLVRVGLMYYDDNVPYDPVHHGPFIDGAAPVASVNTTGLTLGAPGVGISWSGNINQSLDRFANIQYMMDPEPAVGGRPCVEIRGVILEVKIKYQVSG